MRGARSHINSSIVLCCEAHTGLTTSIKLLNLVCTCIINYVWPKCVLLADGSESDESVQLSPIRMFVTGCSELPPLNFTPMPTLHLLHEMEMDGQHSSKYSTASTCDCTLHLPVCHNDFKDFCKAMTFAIMNTQDFGFA